MAQDRWSGRLRKASAPRKITIRLATEDFQVTLRELVENFLELIFVFGGHRCAVADASVAATTHKDAFACKRKLKKVEHFAKRGGVVQIARAEQGETAVSEVMFIEKAHGAVFNFNPVNQVPLKKTEAPGVEMLKDFLVAGERPAEVAALVVTDVKMERSVDAFAPLLAPGFAFSHEQRIAHEMDETQVRKEFERGDVNRFQKRVAGLEINRFAPVRDVSGLFREARANAVEPSRVRVIDGRPEQGGISPVKEWFVPARAIGNVVSKQVAKVACSRARAGEGEEDAL